MHGLYGGVTHNLEMMLIVFNPVKSLVNNKGFDGTDVNSGKTNKFAIKTLSDNLDFRNPPVIEANEYLAKQVMGIYRHNRKITIGKMFRRLLNG